MITRCNERSLPSIYVNSCLYRGTHYSLMAYNIRTESASSTSHRSLPVAGLYTGIFLPLQDSCHSLLMNSCDIETEKNNRPVNWLLKINCSEYLIGLCPLSESRSKTTLNTGSRTSDPPSLDTSITCSHASPTSPWKKASIIFLNSLPLIMPWLTEHQPVWPENNLGRKGSCLHTDSESSITFY